jgi:hypothetical protein
MLTPEDLFPDSARRCNGISCSLRLRAKLRDIDRRVRDQLSGPSAEETEETNAVPERSSQV